MLYEGRNKQPMIATKPIKMRRKDNKRFDEIERALCRNRDIKPVREVETDTLNPFERL